MQTRFLGNTGVQVSELCFGTMSFGGDADEAMSAKMFGACRDAGVNFFDCANVYNGGRSEEILGRLAKDCRDEVVLTTKCYFPAGDGANSAGTNAYHMVRAVEDSLRRLDTDRIDVFFLHRFDDSLPLEETLRGLELLVQQGKILYPAASNFAAWQAARALGVAESNGWARLVCLQPMYNLAKRQAEVEILPMAEAEGLGVIPYSPLGGGLLTGKYRVDVRPDSGRLLESRMYGRRYGAAANYEIAERFTEFAEALGYSPASLAVAWVGAHRGVTAPIIGARNLEQLSDSLASVEVQMTPELRAEIAELSPTPPPATDRNEEGIEGGYGVRG